MTYREKALEIHKNNVVIDAHLDLGGIIFEKKRKGESRIIETYYLDSFRKGRFDLIVAAVYVEPIFIPEMALHVALNQVNDIIEEIEACSDSLMLIKSSDDMDTALKDGKIGIVISLEGSDPILNDIDLLTIFFRLGVRGLGLTWSRRNYVADGSYFGDPEEGARGGLTPFGIQVVKKAEELGMFLDASHLNDEGFDDLIKHTKKPLIASHSNSRDLNQIRRNLNNDQIKTIAERNGVIGLNTYKSIVSLNKDQQNIGRICDHIEHIIHESSDENVGFGFDLCNLLFSSGQGVDVLDNHEESLKITEELLRRGHPEETLKKIIGGNFYRFFRSVL
ncbi:MAG: membrane dipeptidase [Eubacteriales bacterium]|nr:membrane dipeptidase [Eubacteriales bacterium]